MSYKKEILRLLRISREHILEDVDLTLFSGETLGIVGETASGKTCMANIMSGNISCDDGDIFFCGERVSGAELGEGVFYADETSAVIDSLSIAENIFLGGMGRFERLMTINTDRLISESHNALNFVGMSHISPKQRMYELNFGEKKLVELARLIKRGAKAIILDNFFLSVDKTYREKISSVIEKYKLGGGAVVFITRDIDLAKEMCDRIVSMDGGKIVSLFEKDEFDLIKALDVDARKLRDESGEIMLRAVNLCYDNCIKNINFKLFGGEVLGVLGLSGSGIHTLGRAVFGDIQLERGRVSIGGHNIKSIKGAIRRGMAYINNTFGFERTVDILKGKRDIFILDGVISGKSKHEKEKILALIENICARGGGVIFISEDIDEQISICNRIIVLRGGALVGEHKGIFCKKQINSDVIS